MHPPYLTDYSNIVNNLVTPSTVHIHNTAAARFFKRHLLQKAISVFKWQLPDNWDKDYFLYTLYCYGFAAVVRTDKFGVIPQACSLRGFNVFYRPTHAVIVNPLIRATLDPRIDVDCVLFKLTPDYCGIMDIVDYYGDQLALCCESADVNLLNSHLAYVFFSNNQAAAESYKKLYDRIASGEPASVVDKKLLDANGKPSWELFTQNIGQNFIAPSILQAMRTLENHFDTEIGIPNANTEKKERQIVDEVNANNIETTSKLALWLEELQESCKRCAAMFGDEGRVTVEWRYQPEIGGDTNAGNSDNARYV